MQTTLQGWQDAVEVLMMAAAGAGPLMQVRIGVLRGLNRDVERVFNLPERPALGPAEERPMTTV
jgi:hypothetical protein